MIIVNIFRISNDGSTLNISVSTAEGETFTSFRLWSEDTYKSESQALDLTSLLDGTTNKEVLQLSIDDISPIDFDGFIFAEFKSSGTAPSECDTCSNEVVAVALNLSKYQEILLNMVLNLSVCRIPDFDNIINLDVLIEQICTSLKCGYYTEAITLYKTVQRLYSDEIECETCQDLGDPSINTTLNFGILNNNLILK